jgi:hypothetical protein
MAASCGRSFPELRGRLDGPFRRMRRETASGWYEPDLTWAHTYRLPPRTEPPAASTRRTRRGPTRSATTKLTWHPPDPIAMPKFSASSSRNWADAGGWESDSPREQPRVKRKASTTSLNMVRSGRAEPMPDGRRPVWFGQIGGSGFRTNRKHFNVQLFWRDQPCSNPETLANSSLAPATKRRTFGAISCLRAEHRTVVWSTNL